VLSQSPKGNTKGQTGDTVTIVMLAAGASFPMPSLAGDTTVQAAATLGQEQLVVSPTQTSQCSNTVQSGLVVATIPAAGQPVKSGDSVQLVTSSGYCNVTVPYVIGRMQAGALAALKAAGFNSSFTVADPNTCDPSQVGQVIYQSVQPGKAAPFNSSIVLTICETSNGPTTTTIPAG